MFNIWLKFDFFFFFNLYFAFLFIFFFFMSTLMKIWFQLWSIWVNLQTRLGLVFTGGLCIRILMVSRLIWALPPTSFFSSLLKYILIYLIRIMNLAKKEKKKKKGYIVFQSWNSCNFNFFSLNRLCISIA